MVINGSPEMLNFNPVCSSIFIKLVKYRVKLKLSEPYPLLIVKPFRKCLSSLLQITIAKYLSVMYLP